MINFFKSSLIYFLGSTFNKILCFLLIPLYTKYLPPAEYGYYDLTITYVNLFTIVLFFDIGVAFMRFFLESKNKEKTVTNTLVIFLISAFLYIICFSIFSRFVEIKNLEIVIVYGVIYALNTYVGFITRTFKENATFAISGCISNLIIIIINMLGIICFNMNYTILYISSIIGLITQISIMSYKTKLLKHIKFKNLNIEYLKSIYKFALPLALNSIAYWLLTGFNKIIISNQLSVADNGIYSIAEKFSLIINLVGTCFTMAWQELSFEKSASTNETGAFYSKAIDLYIKFAFSALIIFIPSVYIIFPIFVAPQYIAAKQLVPVAIIGSTIALISTFLGNIFYAEKLTKKSSLSTAIASIINIIILFITIPKIGVLAGPVSFCISFLINCIIRIYILRKIKLKVKWKTILPCFLGLSIPCMVYYTNKLSLNIIWLVVSIGIAFLILKPYVLPLINQIYKRRKHSGNMS